MGSCLSNPESDSEPGKKLARPKIDLTNGKEETKYAETFGHPSQVSAQRDQERLVLSFDIGTTASGAAYIYRNKDGSTTIGPDIIDQWPGQLKNIGKTPSVLMYTLDGQLAQPWGAECDSPQYAPGRLHELGLQRVEWFKLHIKPDTVSAQHLGRPDRQLPHGLDAFQVFSDYLGRLHKAALDRIRTKRSAVFLDTLLEAGKVLYILTIPVAWKYPEMFEKLRTAACEAGLISHPESDTLDFCTEPEASALQCYNEMKTTPLEVNDIFTVCDAGGGTVDLTTYQVTQIIPNLEMREVDVGAPRCLFRGASFVDLSFEEVLDRNLNARYPQTYRERHLLRGIQEFTNTIKVQFSMNRQDSQFLVIGFEEEFEHGCVQLPWTEVELAFKPHVDEIVRSTLEQTKTRVGLSKYIFCAGGFGSNDYLRERLAVTIPYAMVLQPDDKSAGSKAVALGACRYGLYRSVKTRISPAHYGISIFRDWTREDERNPSAFERKATRKNGGAIVTGIFSPIVELGADIGDEEARTCRFTAEFFADDAKELETKLYECREEIPGQWVSDPGTRLLCKIRSDFTQADIGPVFWTPTRQPYHRVKMEVHIFLGRTELRANVTADGKICGTARILVV